MACRLAIALMLAANVREPRRIHLQVLPQEQIAVVDFSGLLATDAWGNFVCSAGDGKCKRAAEATVPINDKMIVLGLQAHNHWGGLISYFNADRGGQAYAYKPELP